MHPYFQMEEVSWTTTQNYLKLNFLKIWKIKELLRMRDWKEMSLLNLKILN